MEKFKFADDATIWHKNDIDRIHLWSRQWRMKKHVCVEKKQILYIW